MVFGQNPVDVLGSRKNITGEKFCDFSKKMTDKGATILGGCCETKPSHIKAISKLKTDLDFLIRHLDPSLTIYPTQFLAPHLHTNCL